MVNSRHQLTIRFALLTGVLAALSFTMIGCGKCEPIDIEAYEDPITTAESSYAPQENYFNTVGDCQKDGLACQGYLPASCEEACQPGFTCIQVELRISSCGRNSFFPDRDTGDHWVRRCLEVPNGTEPPDFSDDHEEDPESDSPHPIPELPELDFLEPSELSAP